MMEILAYYIYYHAQVVVYAPAKKGRYTPPVSTLPLYVIWDINLAREYTVNGELAVFLKRLPLYFTFSLFNKCQERERGLQRR
jgi:hypothetical protein